jgi:ferrous iron transport protein A
MELKSRLMELGIIPGEFLRLIRRAPLGCPLEVEVDGTRFALRLEIAREVQLHPHG